MTAGFLEGNNVLKREYGEGKELSKRELYSKNIGEKVELYIRDAGRFNGVVKGLVENVLIIEVKKGKKPALADINEISLLNPLD